MLKRISHLTAIGCRVHRKQPLSRTDEVSIGMAHPELPHVPGIVSQWTHNVGPGLLSLVIDLIGILHEQDDLNAAAALPWCKQAHAFGFPIGRMICCQLDEGLSTRELCIVICLTSDDMKAQGVFKPGDRLLEIAHANLN